MQLPGNLIPWAKAAKALLASLYVPSQAQSLPLPHPSRVHFHLVSQRASRKEPRTGGFFYSVLVFRLSWFINACLVPLNFDCVLIAV